MEKGTINQNPMPRMEILPHGVEQAFELAVRAFKFGRSILRNTNVQLCESNHYIKEHFEPNTGGGAMIDTALYDELGERAHGLLIDESQGVLFDERI